MEPGALKGAWTDLPLPLGRFDEVLEAAAGIDTAVPRAAQYVGVAGIEYMEKFGMRAETFAKVQVKARKHSADNPYSVFRTQLTEEEVMAAPTLFGPVTRYQACPPT